MSPQHARVVVAGLAIGLSCAAALGQWSNSASSNLKIADRSGEQVQPKIKPTSDGGCYVSWFDNSTGGYDVYLQRLNAAGVEQWPHNGVLIADRGVSSTVDYDLVVDGAGDAVITYNDDTVVAGTQQIVVQRVGPAGALLWGAHGVSVSDGTNAFKGNPHVCQLTDGGFAVGYTYNSTVVMQRLDSAGLPQWANFGITLSEASHPYNGATGVVAGASGSFIVAWERARTTGGFNKSIYAQRFDSAGAPLWTGTGTGTNTGSPVVVFDAGTASGLQNGYFPPFLSDGSGGAVFAWYDTGGARNAYLQHVLSDGTLKFPAPIANTGATAGRIRLGAGLSYNAATGNYFLASEEGTQVSTVADTVIVQKFDSAGNRAWGETGVNVIPIGANQPSFVQSQVSGDGCMVLFMNTRSATTRVIEAGRVSGAGSLSWHILVNDDASTDKSRLTSTVSTSGFAIVAYGWGNSGSADIAVQNINADGSLGSAACYANCDGTTNAPVLTVNDFICFQSEFAAGNSYANCDGSTTMPVLTVNDFICFQSQFAAGCS